MIGNDLVHLPTALLTKRLSNERFLDKLFTYEEQKSLKSELDVWKFWAAKEAAYKIVNRLTCERKFAPKDYQVHLSNKTVFSKEMEFNLYYENCNEYIHAICTSGSIAFESTMIYTPVDIKSTNEVIDQLNNRVGETILFECGVPYIHQENQRLPVSISHDNKQLAIVVPVT